jgi:murein DD-endopeptidase MepM/ murein hydrolase activator NlpD
VSPARRFTAARESIPPRPLFPEHEPSRGRSAGSIRRRRRATGIAGAVTAQIDRWTENALSRDKTDDIQSRSRALAGKYLARGFRYARSAGGSAVRGTARHISLGVRLIRATRRGELSAAQAGGVYLRQGGRSLRGVAASAGRALRREAGSAILGFRGGQDLGLQALTRSRDLVLQARQFYRLSRGLLRFLTSPPVLKVMALAALTVIVFSFILGGVSSIASVIPVISLKSPEHELTETWKWITELDTDLKAEILNVERFNPGIDEFHYYLNGRSTALSRMDVETDAETLLAYLDSKYDDYTLATAVISPGGGAVRSVRAEIQRLHGLLYSLAIDEWQEIIIESDTDPDDGVDDSSETIIYHLDVRLTAKPFAEYLAANTALLLNEAEEEKLGALTQAGLFTTYQELGSPFPAGWVVSDRFGYRVHPIYRDKRLHTGLDIAKSEGEPIYACHSGTVSAGGNRTTGYGLWVRISKPNGDNTFYAHLSAQAVPDGTEARKGDLIGYVGNTGVSTGPHLHLEYTKKRQLLNPLFYTPGRVTTFAFIGNLYTRKFHRPTCWTLPNPENRSYFSRREDAVTAGYAPCLHCRP